MEAGKIVLAEFGYGGVLKPSFPKILLDGTKPSRAAWFLKERMLPPMTALGCVSGLAGTANNSTAEAPRGATSNGSAKASPPMNIRARAPVTAMPSRPPSPARHTSPNLTGVPRRRAASILLIMEAAYAPG